MKGKALKYIIMLATVSVAGIFLIQFFFLKSSYSYSEKQFRESASVALKEVAWQILVATGNSSNFDSIAPVEIVSDDFYRVNVGAAIDKELLRINLVEELRKHEIYVPFEFAIFDPVNQQMDQGTMVTADLETKPTNFSFPVNEDYNNYFGVHFPNRTSFFSAHLSVWYFFTALLLVVILFFGYTLWVIIKQRQLSEVQKNFINNLTHELKTPISSIALSASVIGNKDILDSPARLFKYARIIQEQNQRLQNNVEKVLNLASLEKNRIRLNLEETELRGIIAETTEQFGQTDFGRKAKIILNLPTENVAILADRFHFSNLILNILENAVKYCDKNPEITLGVQGAEKSVLLSFADNGIGIRPDDRKKIFKKFYRVPTGNVHNVKGFGLGLDYVKKIVDAHKWKIKVKENPNEGSIFTLIIPKLK